MNGAPDDREPVEPFNPLARQNLASSIVSALLAQHLQSLNDLEPFYGSGVYALYYLGHFPAYELMAARNRKSPDWPIYVGKSGDRTRTGVIAKKDHERKAYERLVHHRRNISRAASLDPGDFVCRYLIVEDIWIPLAESMMIERFLPIWNGLVDGFGNNPQGGGREQQRRSRWDTLHPGRPEAHNLNANESTSDQIAEDVRRALANQSPKYK